MRFRPEKKEEVRSTLHNFCQLGLAPARGSDRKKKCDPLSTISVSSAQHLPKVQTRKKEKCDPLSTISVSSAQHLPEEQTQGQGARCKVQGARCKGKGRDKKERRTTPLRIQLAKRSNYFNSFYSLKHIS